MPPILEHRILVVLNWLRPRLAAKGIVLGRALGCGAGGCVFDIGNGLVAKITRRSSDAFASLWAARTKPEIDALPQIHDVYEVGDVYVIVREDLPDIPKHLPGALELEDYAWAVERFSSRAFDLAAGKRIVDMVELGLALRAQRDVLLRAFREEIAGGEVWIKSVHDLTDLAFRSEADRVILRDLFPQNFGWRERTKNVVIRDLGEFRVPLGPGEMKLAGYR